MSKKIKKLKLIRAPVPSETIWKLGPLDQEVERYPQITVETRQIISSKLKPEATEGYEIIPIKKLDKLDTSLWLEIKIIIEGLDK